jgi:hypothetical protein
MRHQNSVLHDVLKRIPWDVFDQLVERHGTDYRSRRLSTKDQLVALLYGQLSGASSLREITTGLASHRARLYHLGSRPAKRSTLADANEHRPSAVFAELFSAMVGRVHRGLRRAVGEAVYLIDSTGIPLNGRSVDWAHYTAKVCGAKLHVIYDPDADQPIYAAITPSRSHDITIAQQMPIQPGATYVFDLGYYDYAWWAAMAESSPGSSAIRPSMSSPNCRCLKARRSSRIGSATCRSGKATIGTTPSRIQCGKCAS